MTILNQLAKVLKEDNEAITVNFHFGGMSEDPAVQIYHSSDHVLLRLLKMPTEIKVRIEDESELRGEFRKLFYADMEKLKTKNPAAYDKIKEDIYDVSFGQEVKNAMKKDLEADLNELVDHVTTFLKTAISTYTNDYKKAFEEHRKTKAKEIKAEIDRELGDAK